MQRFGAGDEVTLKAKVTTDGGGCAVVIENSYDGHTVIVDRGALTLVQAADDPSKDPVGTVREDPSDGDVGVKVRHDNWTVVRNHDSEPIPFSDCQVGDWSIIGAVPNTPAWDAWVKGELRGAPEFPGKTRELWTGDGSEEPPAHVLVVRDSRGTECRRAGEGWQYRKFGWDASRPPQGAVWDWEDDMLDCGPFVEVRD